MTPQERQLVDDLFDRLSKLESAPRDPDAIAAISDGLRKAPSAVYALVRQFLDRLPEHGLVMCHPGFVDDILVSLDPLTTQREREHAYLAGEHFPRLLAAHKVTLD